MADPGVHRAPAQGRSPLRERVGYYLLGVAIGLALLGIVTFGKRALAPRQQPASPTGPSPSVTPSATTPAPAQP